MCVELFLTRHATGGADAIVLGAGHAYERRANARTAPRYLPHADSGPGLGGTAATGS